MKIGLMELYPTMSRPVTGGLFGNYSYRDIQKWTMFATPNPMKRLQSLVWADVLVSYPLSVKLSGKRSKRKKKIA